LKRHQRTASTACASKSVFERLHDRDLVSETLFRHDRLQDDGPFDFLRMASAVYDAWV
jgi:hypothetical protein